MGTAGWRQGKARAEAARDHLSSGPGSRHAPMVRKCVTKESALRWEAGKISLGNSTRQQAGPEESRGRLEAGQPQKGGGGGRKLLHNNVSS